MKKQANFEFGSVTAFVEQDALGTAVFASSKNDLGARKLNGKIFIRRRLDRVVAVAAALLMSTVALGTAEAQTFTILHNFSGGEGQSARAGLIRDSAGNLYGTTAGGGSSGNGTVFRLDPSGALSVLHNFGDVMVTNDGVNPYGGLVLDSAGNLYGTTVYGGSGDGCLSNCGTVFKLDTAGKYTRAAQFRRWQGDTRWVEPDRGLDPGLRG